MIKIHEVKKGKGYYTITFIDGVTIYGIIVTLVEKRPVYVEFMKFKKDEIISITKENNPEEYEQMKVKYLDFILKHLNE